MKIGIFSIGLGGLTYLKAVARELPEYDYELLADTRQITLPIEVAVGEGVKELLRRGSKLIVVLDPSHEAVANEFSNTKIIFGEAPAELKNYLINNPELEKSLSRNQTRNITLTENTPKTDEVVANILGGTLIRE